MGVVGDASRPRKGKLAMRIYAYDLETTGLNKRRDAPLQVAAVVYDLHLNEIDRLNLRARPPRHALPGPEALLVTGQRITSVMAQPMSHYELMVAFDAHLAQHAPAVVTTYNGLAYDEEILRHCRYRSLLNPYITQFDGRVRFDVMLAARAVAACAPDALEIPVDEEGRPVLKLDRLAPANGFTDHDAHDALGDVFATVHVAEAIRRAAPEVWAACRRMRSKDEMLALLMSGRPIIEIGWGRGPVVRVLQPVCVDPRNRNEVHCVNLAADVSELTALDAASLARRFASQNGVKPLVSIKANAMPLIMALDDPAAAAMDVGYDPVAAAVTRGADGFAARLNAAVQIRRDAYPQPEHVWDQLYTGGFFPMAADRAAFERFHRAAPHQRYEMIGDFGDPRARHNAWWLVGSEWPHVMAPGDRAAFEDALWAHLNADTEDWTTITSALEEIAERRGSADPDQREILEDYEVYLRRLRSQGLPHAAE